MDFFDNNLDILLEDELDDLNSMNETEGEENNNETGNDDNSEEDTNNSEETEIEDNENGTENTDEDVNTEDETENTDDELENDDMDANADEGLSEEEKEAKIKRPFYYDSFVEVLNSTKNFLDVLADKSSRLNNESKKYLIKKISNSLYKQKDDITYILRNKILTMDIENLNNILTMFVTKVETLIELANEIFNDLENNN